MKQSILSISHKLLNEKHKVGIKAEGYSMFPLLYPGDIIYIEKIPFENLVPTDLVVFKRKNKWVVHRLIHKKNNHILKIQGDSCINFDEEVTEEIYIGKAIYRKRKEHIKLLSTESFYGNFLVKMHPYPQYFINLILRIRHKLNSITTYYRRNSSVSTK